MASLFTRRIIAYFADFFVVSAFMWIVSFVLYMVVNPYSMNSIYYYFPFVVPVLILVYFIVCEKCKGATVGKALLYLQVRSNNGEYISWTQAFVRNLTKIYWVPIIFDWAIGKILGKNDRILNSITKTRVFDELR
ncbi:RDD family protein [uncultured Methanobrevibacter sp.]|uniref:RDD family protein n=1 Tax=uncultured Methanobrevibacter sp. TaxID=253161 RepID=UPI0026294784|nr:RDD family protein [uncultured Methanobrevibacter sp.]